MLLILISEINIWYILFFKKLLQRTKNLEEGKYDNFLCYLYGDVFLNKIRIIGCVACTGSHPPAKKGYPGIPDWKSEKSELFSLIPNGLYFKL